MGMACGLVAMGRMPMADTGSMPGKQDLLPDSVVTPNEAEIPESSIVDEVIWVVGNEPIMKSDVENMRLQAEMEGIKWDGDPDFLIPERLAVQKLFLHQAELDSIEVSEAEISAAVDQQINEWISYAKSQEELERIQKKTVKQMRADLREDFKNSQLVNRMQEQLVEDVSVTPSEVRDYFKNLPEDSIPFVPTEVEVEIITKQPKIPVEEVNRVKDQLRSFTERVTKGETPFATLATLYSEDEASRRQGGELDYMGRGVLDPAFAAVAFNLTDPKKISKIVESEFGYHIIQLVDKRGDKVKVRHILMNPKVSQEAIDETKQKLDSLADEIRAGKYEFEEMALYVSDDKDTRVNHGLLANKDPYQRSITSRFSMADLGGFSPEVQRAVENLKVGEISPAFVMKNSKGKTVCAIVKLKNRIEGHTATITEDYQVMRNLVLQKERGKFIHDWVEDKIKHTPVKMKERYKYGKYQYEGWVK